MPVKYGFLKYGSPLVAAAPLLVGLNALPTPAYACNGLPNDPVHCANNDGQVINGFEEFRVNNLQGIPGATTVPGDTPSFDFELDLPQGLSTTNITATPSGPLNSTIIPGQPQFPGRPPLPPAVSTGPGGPLATNPGNGAGVDGFNIGDAGSLGEIQIFSDDGNLPSGLGTMIDDAKDNTGPGGSAEGCDLSVNSCQLEVRNFIVAIDGAVDPENTSRILSAAATGANDDDGPGEFVIFVPGLRNPASNEGDDIGDALVDALLDQYGTAIRIEGDGFAYSESLIGDDDDGDANFYSDDDADVFGDDDDGDADFYSDDDADIVGDDDDGSVAFYSDDDADIVNDDEDSAPFIYSSDSTFIVINNDDDDGDSSASGDPVTRTPTVREEVGDSPSGASEFAQRQLDSLQRLRDRAANETDPVKKQELEERVQRFENLIRSFGSQAVRVSLEHQDARSAPLPGRN